MCNQNIISNKFDLNLSTTLSSYYNKMAELMHYTNFLLAKCNLEFKTKYNWFNLIVLGKEVKK
jgi:hypothetical protein